MIHQIIQTKNNDKTAISLLIQKRIMRAKLSAASTVKSSRTAGRGRVSRCVARPTLPIQQEQSEV